MGNLGGGENEGKVKSTVFLNLMNRHSVLDSSYQFRRTLTEFHEMKAEQSKKLEEQLRTRDFERPQTFKRKFNAFNDHIENMSTAYDNMVPAVELQIMRLEAEKAKIEDQLQSYTTQPWYIELIAMVTESGRDMSEAEKFLVNQIKRCVEEHGKSSRLCCRISVYVTNNTSHILSLSLSFSLGTVPLSRSLFYRMAGSLSASDHGNPDVQNILTFLMKRVNHKDTVITNREYRDWLIERGFPVPQHLQSTRRTASRMRQAIPRYGGGGLSSNGANTTDNLPLGLKQFSGSRRSSTMGQLPSSTSLKHSGSSKSTKKERLPSANQ
eukprot:TRINITY_DN3371_c0_g1_i2.p1 TRINITY_DN3371_c0_g1~~TRINITY_DN3371_c0_g1_i2.p1  ORF type:complete len:324 (-),score=68.75 TRINITY_DN3371_c0_g1_i2:4-975(-)